MDQCGLAVELSLDRATYFRMPAWSESAECIIDGALLSQYEQAMFDDALKDYIFGFG